MSVVLGVEHGGGERFECHVFALRVRQIVAKVAVVVGIVRQLVEDDVIDASYLVAFVEVKSLGEQNEMNATLEEQESSPIDALLVVVSRIYEKKIMKIEKVRRNRRRNRRMNTRSVA